MARADEAAKNHWLSSVQVNLLAAPASPWSLPKLSEFPPFLRTPAVLCWHPSYSDSGTLRRVGVCSDSKVV